MKHALGNQSAESPVSDDSALREAIRQWVELCMLHLEHKKIVVTPTNESPEE